MELSLGQQGVFERVSRNESSTLHHSLPLIDAASYYSISEFGISLNDCYIFHMPVGNAIIVLLEGLLLAWILKYSRSNSVTFPENPICNMGH